MRRRVFLLLGLLEMGLAITLMGVGQQLPTSAAVGAHVGRVGRVTQSARDQVAVLQHQVGELRRPELQRLAGRLGPQAQRLAKVLTKQTIDFVALATLNQTLVEVARSLEVWRNTLDPEQMGKWSQALGTTANYLEQNVIPAGKQAATQMEQAVAGLERHARQLSQLLHRAPPNLQAARDIYTSLGSFEAGLERVTPVLKLERLDTIEQGFAGMETALVTTKRQVERLSRYTYPIIRLENFRPKVTQKPFWPAGSTIAEGLGQAIKGLQAVNTELAKLDRELPALRRSLDESRSVVGKTREAMGEALKHQAQIEALLEEIPKQSVALAEQLPRLGKTFAQMLRETKQLTEVVRSLRQVQTHLTSGFERWPEVRNALQQSAGILRHTHAQVEGLLAQREVYEQAHQAMVQMVENTAEVFPLVGDGLDVRLSQQESTLGELKQGLDEVHQSLPALEQASQGMLNSLRWVLWVMATLVGVHGAFVLIDSQLRPQA